MSKESLDLVLEEVSKCQTCVKFLPHAPNPILSVKPNARVLIIGQAPGQKVHDSGMPWQDKSGDQLQKWLGVSKEQFFESGEIGTMPMGFCYPGRNAKGSGDAPPRPECAPQWHDRILNQLEGLKLTLIIGNYAMKAYLGTRQKKNLTETVRNYKEYLPEYFPLVHPSPLNFRWQGKNPWFIKEVVPELQKVVKSIIS